jgi:NAD(P)-dependent dehydrogenase (short-subunit alcohol dehydrogenase family)
MEKLSGKTALVTGSTDGVGRLVARKLGQAGARVLVHGRDAERGARVVADIEASGGAADFLALVQIAGTSKHFLLRRSDFRPEAPRSRLQVQRSLERPDVPV